jgi:hypothetical protein
MNKIINRSEAELLKKEDIKEFNSFIEDHFDKNNDEMIKILKAHIYVEIIMNDIFMYSLPKPKNLLKNMKFSKKIDLLEAISGEFGSKIIAPLTYLNLLRNKFSHEIDYIITKDDISSLANGLKLTDINLRSTLIGIIGYLHALRTITKKLPFLTSCLQSKKLYESDKGFNAEAIRTSYGSELNEFFEGLRT